MSEWFVLKDYVVQVLVKLSCVMMVFGSANAVVVVEHQTAVFVGMTTVVLINARS
jgi:hypothetical protein